MYLEILSDALAHKAVFYINSIIYSNTRGAEVEGLRDDNY